MTSLLKYDEACRAVAEAKSFDEVRDWEDKAAAVREYTRRIGNRGLELDAIEIRERARRRRGELLLLLKEQGQIARGRKMSAANDILSLDQLGITRDESARDQKVAALPGDAFERLVARCRRYAEEHPEKHTFDMLRAEEKETTEAQKRAEFEARISVGGKVDDLHSLIAEGRKFGAILADPPWHFVAYSDKGEGRSAANHYTTDRTWRAIIELPVKHLAADDCVLFMWMVDWCPKLALEVIEAWGFVHKTTAFTWAKENKSGEGWHMGNGYWTRANPEDCWLATRGHPKRLHADVRQLLVAPVGEHSVKPDEVHERIERLVAGPYLELYARCERKGWVTWGNEIPFDPHTGEIIESETAAASAPPAQRAAEPSASPPDVTDGEPARGLAARAGSTLCKSEEAEYLEIPLFLRRGGDSVLGVLGRLATTA